MSDNPCAIGRSMELVPHFSYQSRREFVEELAYRHWIKRGQPLGSPEIDWCSAEQALYCSLVAAGLITPSDSLKDLGRRMYRRIR